MYKRNKATALYSLGRLDEAADHSRRAVALAPTDKEAQETLRTALTRLGRLEELHHEEIRDLLSLLGDHSQRLVRLEERSR